MAPIFIRSICVSSSHCMFQEIVLNKTRNKAEMFSPTPDGFRPVPCSKKYHGTKLALASGMFFPPISRNPKRNPNCRPTQIISWNTWTKLTPPGLGGGGCGPSTTTSLLYLYSYCSMFQENFIIIRVSRRNVSLDRAPAKNKSKYLTPTPPPVLFLEHR